MNTSSFFLALMVGKRRNRSEKDAITSEKDAIEDKKVDLNY